MYVFALVSIVPLLTMHSLALIIGTQFQQKDNATQEHIVSFLKLYSLASISLEEVIVQSQSLPSHHGVNHPPPQESISYSTPL